MKTVLKNVALGLVKVGRGLLKAALFVSDHKEVIESTATTVGALTGHPEVGVAITAAVNANSAVTHRVWLDDNHPEAK